MTGNICKRLSAFEPTITHIANSMGVTKRVEAGGLERSDFTQALRMKAWMVMKDKEVSDLWVQKCLWNAARDMVRTRKFAGTLRRSRRSAHQHLINAHASPWESLNERLDVQKLLDSLRAEEVQILQCVAVHGVSGATKVLGLHKATFFRRLKTAQRNAKTYLRS